tara:strand:+ start:358 stop:1731 length:1374 start_codon:yes stop_codon:yes gene_type:complete
MTKDSNTPTRIRPYHETLEPDGPIILVKEVVRVFPAYPRDENKDLEAEGELQIIQRWSPMRLEFKFEGDLVSPDEFDEDEDEFPIEKDLDSFGDSVRFESDFFTTEGLVLVKGAREIHGEIDAEEFITGTDHKLDRVTFHIPNYHEISGSKTIQDRDGWSVYDWSEIKLEADNWLITLQPYRNIRELNQQAFLKYKTVLSGIGEIKKNDGSQFKIVEVQRLIEALHFFLSFVFLEWTPPLLVVGSNKVKEKSWQHCRNYDVRRSDISGLKSWAPFISEDLSHAFQCFLVKWSNPEWREPLELSITWLIESTRQSEQSAGAIAFGQIPIEMLAWMVFVDEKTIIADSEFKKLSAASIFQLLLSHCQISLDVPNSMTSLKKLIQKTRKISTAPQLLTTIRNTIIHPHKNNRKVLQQWEKEYGIEIEAIRNESQILLQHYITLILLFLIDYQGEYRSLAD